MPIRRTPPPAQSTTAAPLNPLESQLQPSLTPVRQRQRQPPAPSSDAADNISSPDSEGSRPADYAVGYGRPPRHTQFKPGSSGNPRGRPKAAKGLKTIVRETMTAKVKVRTAAGDTRMTRIEAVVHKTVELAMKSNPRALAQLLGLYQAAVPDVAPSPGAALASEDVTAADIAALEELKAMWRAEQEGDE